MRKTKIVCTIGPASCSEETLRRLCLAGMNVARLNFSHGTHEEHKKTIDLIKKVRDELSLPVAILLDTKGPEYRIGAFEGGKIELCDGERFTFTTEDIVGDRRRVSVSYKGLADDLEEGDKILLNNGLVSFRVEEISGSEIICRTLEGGTLSNRKSMSFPGKVMSQVYLSEQDMEDIAFGVAHDVEFIACSFVSARQDLLDIKNYLAELGAQDIELIAKIENQAGIDNIEEICSECSGIMIGRGDMGVEIAYEKVPAVQKHLITKCRMLGKRVITATEMLESMISNPRPTRAEISDVANAVYDGTSAVMLSGETAAGKYPVEALLAMSRIAEQTESDIDYEKRFREGNFRIKNTVDAISHSACGMSHDLSAKAIVVCSHSGITARMVSRFRPSSCLVGLTTDAKASRRLALSWGVNPVVVEEYPSVDVLFYVAKKTAKEMLGLSAGDKIIITGGKVDGSSGNTDLIKVETV